LPRNCLLKHDIEGNIEGRSDGKTRKKTKLPPNDLQESRLYWKLKEEELDRSLWITRFGSDYGPVVRRTT